MFLDILPVTVGASITFIEFYVRNKDFLPGIDEEKEMTTGLKGEKFGKFIIYFNF